MTGNIDLSTNETASVVTAEAEDESGGTYPVSVESVTKVPGMSWLSQVVIRFPDQWLNPKDVWVTIRLHGVPSNKAFVTVKP